MRHGTAVEGFAGTPEELAEAIGDLRYDALCDLLVLLAATVERDGVRDAARGRRRLAAALHRAAGGLEEAANAVGDAWHISEPFMREG